MKESTNFDPYRPLRHPLTVEAMLADVLELFAKCPKSEGQFYITPTSEVMGDLCSRLLQLESQMSDLTGVHQPATMLSQLTPHTCDVCKPKRKRKVKP